MRLRGLRRRGHARGHRSPAPAEEAATLERAIGNRAMRGLLDTGRPLDPDVRARMERALGADLGDVRVHTDGEALAEVRRHGAEAMAVGRHVTFERGRYAPGTPLGDALLAHELAHTVQQQGDGPGGVPSARLETDANRSALGALWGRAAAGAGPRLRSGTQMQFFACEVQPAYEAPSYLGPHSRRAIDDINRIVESGTTLQQLIVIGTAVTLATSTPEETLATGGYDVAPQAEALRAVPVIVRSRIITIVQLLLVQHENEMNQQERQFWNNILRRLNAL
jgi:hypothetical protein